MNLHLVSRLLGIVCLLIGVMLTFSLPWALPLFGATQQFEKAGFFSLVATIAVCFLVGWLLHYAIGGKAKGVLYRKEAMAVVGLSWMLATVLGAIPYLLSGTYRDCVVVLHDRYEDVVVYDQIKDPLPSREYYLLSWIREAGRTGITEEDLQALLNHKFGGDKPGPGNPRSILEQLKDSDDDWDQAIEMPPSDTSEKSGEPSVYRLMWNRMNFADAIFESQSGFSTTGATVITHLEDPKLVPRCILFWRSSTHFLGGLGIIVLFVVVLGQGSAGKALMRAEMPGPTKEGALARMQHTAWTFTACYCGLNILLTIILCFEGMDTFDALCHAFGTMATGGFSTYNASLGHFASVEGLSGELIEYTVIVFMILAGTNFTLLYFMMLGKPKRLFADIEWRTYIGIIVGVSILVVLFGLLTNDFQNIREGVRYGLFQVVSIMTTTGYGTHDFDSWNSFGRGVLFLLMFVGGCAGSTGGGMKVIRHILFLKVLRLEIEKAFHPTVVRPLRLGGEPIDDPDLGKNILVYFGLILVIFVFSWMLLVTIEPDVTWLRGNTTVESKLIDSASGVASTLNNIGPGLGTIGATQNYAHFSPTAKILFTWLMMIGRLEIFAILVLFVPKFWRDHS